MSSSDLPEELRLRVGEEQTVRLPGLATAGYSVAPLAADVPRTGYVTVSRLEFERCPRMLSTNAG